MPHQDWRDSLDDRPHGSGGFGDRSMSFLRRIFGDGENPLMWGIPLYRAFGIRVRLHVLFAIWIIFELLGSLPKDTFGLAYTAPIVVGLFVLVLLHEYGHCFACRAVGGEADEIMLWPLGGLAFCAAPRRWRAEFITVAGGPLVNVALFPVLFAVVWLATGSIGSVVFNPFEPATAVGALAGPLPLWLTYALWSLYYTNGVLLAFNVLVPMYPLDGGRLAMCLLWAKLGSEERARYIATTVGLVAAGALAVLALVSEETLLLGIAFFGGITCWLERRTLRFQAEAGFGADDLFTPDRGYAAPGVPEPEPEPSKREVRREQREREEQAEVDRILEKISAEGIDALTAKEKRALKRATERSRGG